MYSRAYKQVLSKVAIFLVLFATLAPSISHALVTQNKNNNFLQEVCSSNNTKQIVLQVITTQGHQLQTVLDTKSSKENTPAGLVLHFEHCPFCAHVVADQAIVAPGAAWVFMQAEHAKIISLDYDTTLQPTYIQTAHPSRAPPNFN